MKCFWCSVKITENYYFVSISNKHVIRYLTETKKWCPGDYEYEFCLCEDCRRNTKFILDEDKQDE
jgi:hypothetical protein